ncbi:MAG: peptidyl-prolyl cis-trans isomerase [Candidatus Zhuqueibacterota bacterium]
MICLHRIFVFSAFLALFACEKSDEKPQEVLVSVGNGYLTLERIQSDIPVSIKKRVTQENVNNYIQQWIETELVYQDALSQGMHEDAELINAIEKAKKNYLVSKYLSKYLDEKSMELETEALEYYEENKDSYVFSDDMAKVNHILVDTYQAAINAKNQIEAGEDFEKIARDVSLDYSEKKRITLDYFSREEIIPEVGAQAFSLSIGSVSSPIKSDFGYHIIQVIDRQRKGSVIEFEDVKDQIISRLRLMKKNERYRDLIIELRNKINIKKNEELLQHLFVDSLYTKETNSSAVKE